jgi:hypothetical protein
MKLLDPAFRDLIARSLGHDGLPEDFSLLHSEDRILDHRTGQSYGVDPALKESLARYRLLPEERPVYGS